MLLHQAYLGHFLFWHIKVYIGIAQTYLGIFVIVCNLGILTTLACLKCLKCIRIYQLPFINVSATRK